MQAFGSRCPAVSASRAVTVGAGVPGAGRGHVVKCTISADGVVGVGSHAAISALDDELPQANAALCTLVSRAFDVPVNFNVFGHSEGRVYSKLLFNRLLQFS